MKRIMYARLPFISQTMLFVSGFIGYAKDVYEIISYTEVADTADDQLYYTNIFLDPTLRVLYTNIFLDPTLRVLYTNIDQTLRNSLHRLLKL